ncbi:helix-turn-helix domain-containing protein [Nocardia sp. NPDC005366]|uniref:helix-turn-helix domain-containing protein n=1 Tax=Nocardia sp. NPDC005366 TaxID=3156878 RepID=UPI0033B696A4
MNHKKREQAGGGKVPDERDQRIRHLRDLGATYQQIARQLGIAAPKVEVVLGEATALREAGFTVREIAERVGLPRASAHRLIADKSGASSLWTARRTTAVAGLVDLYGMQTDVLAWYLNMDESHVYGLVKQMYADRLVTKPVEVLAGAKWVVPTGETAASYLGWRPYTVWKPPDKDVEHYRAVAQARIMLAGSDPHRWVSERRLRHDAEVERRRSRSRFDSTGHIHDGRFLGRVSGTYGWWAVEVERTQKSASNMDKALRGAIWAARDAQPEPMIGILYLYRGRTVEKTVMAAVDRLPDELAKLDMHLALHDFDAEWTKFLGHRAAVRATSVPNLSPSPASKDVS